MRRDHPPASAPPQIKITSQRTPRALRLPLLIAVTLGLSAWLLTRLHLPGTLSALCAVAVTLAVAIPAIIHERRRFRRNGSRQPHRSAPPTHTR